MKRKKERLIAMSCAMVLVMISTVPQVVYANEGKQKDTTDELVSAPSAFLMESSTGTVLY